MKFYDIDKDFFTFFALHLTAKRQIKHFSKPFKYEDPFKFDTMEYLHCPDISIFAFPLNLIGGLVLILGIWILHRYYFHTSIVQWLTGMPATLWICSLIILLLIFEGIWALQLFKTWIFVFLLLFLLLILGLIVLKKSTCLSGRNFLFLLNHGGLWLAIASALLGVPDREEYKMLVPLGINEYNTVDQQGILHPLPFTVRLDKFELDYYPETVNARIPKRFCSTVTCKSGDEEKQFAIQVNQPARFKGYSLYQDGYDTEKGNESQYSILLVVRDPWIYLVYTGIFMLLAGAIGLIIYGPIKRGIV